MTIKEERQYKNFKSLMDLDPVETEDDPGPYWVSKLPWTKRKEELVINKPAVLSNECY